MKELNKKIILMIKKCYQILLISKKKYQKLIYNQLDILMEYYEEIEIFFAELFIILMIKIIIQ